jgi:hypothetical protein
MWHGDGKIGIGNLLPLFGEASSSPSNGRISWLPAHVEAGRTDDGVELVLDSVHGSDSPGGDFADGLSLHRDIVLTQCFKVSVAGRRASTADSKVGRNHHLGDFGFACKFGAHFFVGELIRISTVAINAATQLTSMADFCSAEPFKMNRNLELSSDSICFRYRKYFSGSSRKTFLCSSLSASDQNVLDSNTSQPLDLHSKLAPFFPANLCPNPAVTQVALRMKLVNDWTSFRRC